jgi:molybdate transport system substrate-binding protein
MSRLLPISMVLLILSGVACNRPDRPDRSALPILAGASDLGLVLPQVLRRFATEEGELVALNLGSSGNLATQMLQGAPYEIFMSADEDFVFRLLDAGIVEDSGVVYGIGRIVIFVPRSSALEPRGDLTVLREMMPQISTFAVANWEHAPYGRAAREALMSAGVWELVQPKVVQGENIAQTAQFVTSGSADAGIIALSLAMGSPLRGAGRYALIPDSLHTPLVQRMVLASDASPAARRFYEYLQQPAAREIMQKYGFMLPDERQ